MLGEGCNELRLVLPQHYGGAVGDGPLPVVDWVLGQASVSEE